MSFKHSDILLIYINKRKFLSFPVFCVCLCLFVREIYLNAISYNLEIVTFFSSAQNFCELFNVLTNHLRILNYFFHYKCSTLRIINTPKPWCRPKYVFYDNDLQLFHVLKTNLCQFGKLNFEQFTYVTKRKINSSKNNITLSYFIFPPSSFI